MNLHHFLRIVAFTLVVFNMIISADCYPGQRAFHNGMRYGRSENLKKMGARRTMIAPGGERFIMGTRYGKRSSFVDLPEPLIYPRASSDVLEMKGLLCGKHGKVLCTFIGMANLYRCNRCSYGDETSTKGRQPDARGELLKE